MFRSLKILLLLILFLSSSALGAQELVKVTSQRLPEGGFAFSVSNPYLYPVQVEVTFPRLVNMQADVRIPFFIVLPPQTPEKRIIVLKPGGEGRYGYNLSYLVFPGDPEKQPDAAFKYRLPFRHGTKHKVGQGYFGTFSHSTQYGEFALDFDMKEGTPVLAARAGVVVETKQDGTLHGLTSDYAKHGNYVLILHGDGTFARYLHLRYGGVTVAVGDHVRAGQEIGYSGNTGWTSGPHLHFQVSAPERMRLRTIPTDFHLDENGAGRLVAGRYYYAWHPGGAPFTRIFGIDITNDTHAGHDKQVPQDDKVDVRTEQVDDTILFFARNGKTGTVTLVLTPSGLRNVTASKPLPLTVRLAPGREIFLFLLRPADPARDWGYGYQLSYTW